MIRIVTRLLHRCKPAPLSEEQVAILASIKFPCC